MQWRNTLSTWSNTSYRQFSSIKSIAHFYLLLTTFVKLLIVKMAWSNVRSLNLLQKFSAMFRKIRIYCSSYIMQGRVNEYRHAMSYWSIELPNFWWALFKHRKDLWFITIKFRAFSLSSHKVAKINRDFLMI